MLIAGIDPGLEGAIAFLECVGAHPLNVINIVDVLDMPVLNLSRGRKARREIDVHALAALFRDRPPAEAYLERAGSRPKQGVASAFAFGNGYGAVRGILIALDIPLTRVDPGVWKRALAVPAAKDGARARASEIFPGQSARWRLVKHHGRAESALIGLYGVRLRGKTHTAKQAAERRVLSRADDRSDNASREPQKP
jgi:crossover junction endodeoxyribonuclease RuvC